MPKHAFFPIADRRMKCFQQCIMLNFEQLFEEHFDILLSATFFKTMDVAGWSESDVMNWLSRNLFTDECISSFER
jgi:hypothetical protein